MIRALTVGLAGLLLVWGGQAFATPPAPSASTYNWTGMYFGAHVDAGWAANDWTLSGTNCCGGGTNPPLGTGTSSGLLGGLQAGMNWEEGRVVFGLQGDVSVGGISGTAGRANPHLAGNCWAGGDQTAKCSAQTDLLANLTARAGVLVMPDTLLYIKGGVAFAHDSFQVHDSTSGGGCFIPGPDYAAVGQGRTGGTIGIGAEHAFNNHTTMFAEYDYSDFGTQNVAFADTGNSCSPAFTAAIAQTVQVVKVGVNIHY
jgi:outer membrane immunogenic protein